MWLSNEVIFQILCFITTDFSDMSDNVDDRLHCLLCDQVTSDQYLGSVTAPVQAHDMCIKFAKGIKNKKSVVGKTRLQVSIILFLCCVIICNQ